MSIFERGQESYFTKELNRSIPTYASQLPDKTILQQALGNIDPYSDGEQVFETKGFISNFGSRSGVVQRDAECRAIPYPGPAMRSPDARTGCGWWFSQNPNVPSIGAYGTRRGPMSSNLDVQIGPGKWIWDPKQAAALEGQKSAGKFRTCQDIQFSQNPNIGWCRSTGRALMTDGAGNPAFPRSIGGDCPGGEIVMNASGCNPHPAPIPDECKPNGVALGSPSTDNGRTRTYTQNECNLMNGTWYPNGECLKKGGGSYSAICAGLNPKTQPSPSGTGVSDLCAPMNGRLSPACLQSLSSFSCSPNGLLAKSLGSGYAGTTDTFNNVNSYLVQRGFTIHSGIVRDGQLSTQDALTSFSGLKSIANTGDNSRATQAAMNLCYGSPFNPCVFNDTDRGPFDSNCITQAAIAMGYSTAGRLLPSHAGMSAWNQKQTWKDVMDTLTSWKNIADRGSEPMQQATAVAYVYGISVSFPVQNCPPPTPSSPCAPSGVKLGHPGNDNAGRGIRLYTNDECNQIGGNWNQNGECLKRGGGSWSWDCR